MERFIEKTKHMEVDERYEKGVEQSPAPRNSQPQNDQLKSELKIVLKSMSNQLGEMPEDFDKSALDAVSAGLLSDLKNLQKLSQLTPDQKANYPENYEESLTGRIYDRVYSRR